MSTSIAFEYLALVQGTHYGDMQDMQRILNALGSEGWICAGIIPGMVLLQRAVPQPQGPRYLDDDLVSTLDGEG